MRKALLWAVAAMALSVKTQAAESFWQFSLFPEVATRDITDTVTGVSLNLWGMNARHGLALGVVNGSYGDSSGFSIGFVNYGENFTGLNLGLLNATHCDFEGWQAGIVNYAADNCNGFQLGFLNYAGRLTGLQLGLVNMAAQADRGLQLGLVNLLPETRTWFAPGMADQCAPAMLFANWRF
jgi:hypothetical protein